LNSFELPGSLREEGLGPPGRRSWRDLAASGYRFEPFGARPFETSVALLHEVLTRSFTAFPGYTPIGLPEFRGLMGLARDVIHPRCSTFAFDDAGSLAGFATVFVDVADAVRAMNGGTSPVSRVRFLWRRRAARRLLLHLGGITSAEAARHSGLGRALFQRTIGLVRDERCDALIGSLIARGNPVRRFFGSYAADERREYALYEVGA
jgi:hypothetical protein